MIQSVVAAIELIISVVFSLGVLLLLHPSGVTQLSNTRFV